MGCTNGKPIKKDVKVKLHLNTELPDIEVKEIDGNLSVDLEQLAYEIQQYILDGGDYDLHWDIAE